MAIEIFWRIFGFILELFFYLNKSIGSGIRDLKFHHLYLGSDYLKFSWCRSGPKGHGQWGAQLLA